MRGWIVLVYRCRRCGADVRERVERGELGTGIAHRNLEANINSLPRLRVVHNCTPGEYGVAEIEGAVEETDDAGL